MPYIAPAPPWRGEDLGRPIPGSVHSISMALPLWDHVVGYEEKRPDIMRNLKVGYPRFVVHPLVQEVARAVSGNGPACLPFPSATVAEKCAAFVRSLSGSAQVISSDGLSVVTVNSAGADALKAFWQHSGWILSTRQALSWLERGPAPDQQSEARHELRKRVAGLYDCDISDVFLVPTGMAAQHAALEVIQACSPGLPTAQLGFPYVDTLKLQQKLGHGGILLHNLDSLVSDLEALIQKQPIAGCFCEVPGNPLLGSADLRRVSPVLRKHGLPLVVDDVVATPFNIDVSPYADMIATSLTKFMAGNCEVMGGALICNPRSPLHARLKALAAERHEDLLWGADAAVLERAAAGFPERMRRHNASGLLIAERLRAHPMVERVWYPKWEFSEAYEAVRRPDGGWSALVTFLPVESASRSPGIYDRLEICKGPSLGTEFTLACPFTLLAHYTELDWAESCGVSRYLIRISVGLEDVEEIWAKLDKALQPA